MEISGGVLYFQGTKIVPLALTDLNASQRADLEELVDLIGGLHADEIPEVFGRQDADDEDEEEGGE